MPKPKRSQGKESQTKITRHLIMEKKQPSTPGVINSQSDTPFTPASKNDNKRPLSSPENAETGITKQPKPEDTIENDTSSSNEASETSSVISIPSNTQHGSKPNEPDIVGFMSRIEGKITNLASTQNQILEKLAKLDLIEQNVDHLKQRVSDIERIEKKHETELTTVTEKLNDTQVEITALSDQITSTQIDMESIRDTISKTDNMCSAKENNHIHAILVNQAKLISEMQVKDKAYSQRHNLLFENVPEKQGENCVMVIDNIMYSHAGEKFAASAIDKAHRIGPKIKGRIRPIVVRFKTHQAKEFTYRFKKTLATASIYVKLHLPEETRYQDNLINKVATVAHTRDRSARRVGDKILYKQEVHTLKDLESSDLDLQSIHQKENDKAIGFLGRLSPLSNFHKCEIVDKGRRYNCSEQMYQQLKAEHYGDLKVSAEIGLMDEPVLMKRKARQITLPSEERPNENRELDKQLMLRALKAKFSETAMKAKLLQTGQKLLVELNAHDIFFGAGIPLVTVQFNDKNAWKGQNVMGQLLMQLRDELNKPMEKQTNVKVTNE